MNMVFKYNFSVSGTTFYPEKILEKIQGVFLIDSYFKPTDSKFPDSLEEYGYGNISFWHPKKFSTENHIVKYENDFAEFIENNYLLFIQNGADEFEIFMEIYFDGGQCNFEIFNKDLLRKLGNFGVSLPVSIYALQIEAIQEWEDDISLVWQCP